MHLTRSALYSTIASTATRLLLERDTSPNRTGAYIRARHQAETIALRNLALIDAKRKGAPTQTETPAAESTDAR